MLRLSARLSAGGEWIFVADARLMAAMRKGGVTETMVDVLIEIEQIINSGEYVADYLRQKPALGPHTLNYFAAAFAAVYNAPRQLVAR